MHKPMKAKSERIHKARLVIAAVGGLLAGSSTFAVGRLSVISNNKLLGLAQETLMVLLLPGLIGSGLLFGNVHAFPLALAACINVLLTCGLLWLVCSIVLIWSR